MAVYQINENELLALEKTELKRENIKEKVDLQRLLRKNIAIVSPETLVIAEEFSDWEESNRRIDLLGIDKNANIVVIELKRGNGDHMELQALRYAAMISPMTFGQAVDAFQKFRNKSGDGGQDAEGILLDFLEKDDPDQIGFGADVRLVLVSEDFSKELTTSVVWLIERGLDIRCVRIEPYKFNGEVFLDVQEVLPLPKLSMIEIKDESQQRTVRRSVSSGRDLTRYDLTIETVTYPKLSQRKLVLCVIKEACIKRGCSPEKIQDAIPYKNRWAVLAGEYIDEDIFLEVADLYFSEIGKSFNSDRFNTRSEDLIQFEGKTYALTNQWWKEATIGTVDAVIKLVGKGDIVYKESSV